MSRLTKYTLVVSLKLIKILYDFNVETVDAYVNESKGNDSLENNDERTTRRERSKLIYSSKTFARNTTVRTVGGEKGEGKW